MINGHYVSVVTFASTGDRDRFFDAIKGFEGPEVFVVGPTWVVATDTTAHADPIHAKLGGEITRHP